MTDQAVLSPLTVRRSGQFRLAGMIILISGIAGALLLYWVRTRGPQVADDPRMLGFYKKEDLQMRQLYGKSGMLANDLVSALERPDTQAILIGGISTAVSLGCFFISKRWRE